MSNEIVQSVQTRLQELGYYGGKIDGDAGPNTEAAIADFKSAHGFVARPYPVIQTPAPPVRRGREDQGQAGRLW